MEAIIMILHKKVQKLVLKVTMSNYKKYIITFFVCCISIIKAQAQKVDTIGININEYQGVLIIKEIKKRNSISKDSSLFQSRLFQPFCHLLKRTPYPRNMMMIDSTKYDPDNEGIIDVTISKGWHTISIQYDMKQKFIPFRSVRIKFKRKKIYIVDIYLPTPFPAVFH